MLESPRIVDVPERKTAVIRLTIPREEIRNVMGPGILELMEVLAAQGIAPTGPWFTHHFRMEPEIFDFEIGIPVAAQVKPAGRVVPSRLPATRVAQADYQGPYESLSDAWGEFDAWTESQKLSPASDLWECYVVGPESTADSTAFRTELNRPLED